MKLSIPAVTLCVLLSSDKILTKAESVSIAMAATEPEVKKKVKAYEVKEEKPKEEIDWEERSKRLNEKLNTMINLRMKLWTRGGYVVKSKKACRPPFYGPTAMDVKGLDVGILGCGSSGDVCIQDSSSSLGGVCAGVVLTDHGYGNKTVGHDDEEGVVSSRSNNISMLKPLSDEEKLKLANILKSAKEGDTIRCDPGTNEGYVEVGDSNPCKHSGHVCVKDPLSALGGTCVDTGYEDEQFLWKKKREKPTSAQTPKPSLAQMPKPSLAQTPKPSLAQTPSPKFRPAQICTYKNGESGLRCTGFDAGRGLNACEGLSDYFIENNIGCGSCNEGWSACSRLSKDSSIGERSCNGMGCGVAGGANGARVTVGDDSCNGRYSCHKFRGSLTVGSDSCSGAFSCSLNDGPVTTIGSNSCGKDGACSFVSGTTTIGNESCNHCYSCSHVKDETTVKDGSCYGAFACAYATGNTTIQSNSCTGSAACKGVAGVTTVQDGSCNGSSACAYADGMTTIRSKSCLGSDTCQRFQGKSEVGYSSCLGVGTCKMAESGLQSNAALTVDEDSWALTVGDHSCLGCYACNNIAGLVSISSGSCYEFSSCRDLVGTVTIGSSSCQKIKSCRENWEDSYVTIGDRACNAGQVCCYFAGSVTVPNDGCNSNGNAEQYGCAGRRPSDVSPFEIDSISSSSTGAKLRGGVDTSNIGCLPHAQKVKLQQFGTIDSMHTFGLEVTSSGVNVAEGKAVMTSDVAAIVAERTLEHSSLGMSTNAWEVDLEDNFLISSVSVLNTWCNKSEDLEKCLCNLSGATLTLIDGSGKEVTSVSAGDTCGQETLEFVFDASAEFCESTPVGAPSRSALREQFRRNMVSKARPCNGP